MTKQKAEKKTRKKSKGALAPREPFEELDGVWPFGGEVSTRLERLFRELDGAWSGPSGRRVWSPALDVHETDAAYAVTVELAGAQKEDVTVECHENMLTIRGEKRSEREEEQESSRFVERCYGSFRRSFSLSGDADAEKIDARFENGVLTLTIPKSKASKPRTVAVK